MVCFIPASVGHTHIHTCTHTFYLLKYPLPKSQFLASYQKTVTNYYTRRVLVLTHPCSFFKVPAWKRNLLRSVIAIVIALIAVMLRKVFAYVGALVGKSCISLCYQLKAQASILDWYAQCSLCNIRNKTIPPLFILHPP